MRTGWQILTMVGLVLAFSLSFLASLGKWAIFDISTTALGRAVVVWTTAYVVIGAVLAVRRTATHRAVPWILPLALPLAVPLVPWLGSQVQQVYLQAFGVSLGTNGEGLGRAQAGLWVLLVFSGTLLLPIAHLGWIRYVNSSTDARGSWMSWAPMLTVGATLGFALSLLVLFTAGHAGGAARDAAARGQTLPEYFGLRADYICVKLISADSPFLGIRPPSDRVLITFGPEGDRIDLWVPPRESAAADGHRSSGASSSIRLEDAQITKVPDRQAACPAAGPQSESR